MGAKFPDGELRNIHSAQPVSPMAKGSVESLSTTKTDQFVNSAEMKEGLKGIYEKEATQPKSIEGRAKDITAKKPGAIKRVTKAAKKHMPHLPRLPK